MIISAATLSATRKLEALIDFHLDFFVKECNVSGLILGHSDWKIFANLESLYVFGLKPYTQLIAKILQEGIATGEFRPLELETVAIAIIGSLDLNILAKDLLHKTEDLAAIKKGVKAYILNGVSIT